MSRKDHKKKSAPLPIYNEGLAFECTGCGQCCTGSPGYVWVSEKEIVAIAEHLEMSVEDFSKKHIRQANGKFSLLERPKSYDCVFLKGKQCSIYEVRPIQCRTFPWWPQNLESKAAWEETARYCEGIKKDAPVVEGSHIKKQLSIQEEANLSY